MLLTTAVVLEFANDQDLPLSLETTIVPFLPTATKVLFPYVIECK